MKIPCLSLWQPWASLVAFEIKRVETRGQAFPRSLIGTNLGIHAAKITAREVANVMGIEIIRKAEIALNKDREEWTRGAIVCTARVMDSAKVLDHREGFAVTDSTMFPKTWRIDQWGDFNVGRFLYLLAAVKRINPFPVRGAQGIFYVDVPALEPFR